ncbi:hypothetical protein [Thiocapsa marina]|uniref:Uncharacterized protein n=1 Tax=Thiocapsa marina 5811 TaxID=768671 RepID=F9U7V8_9GAMM|nr:hypothetical protein [Thiocapsa marina]EGV19738.1 hypothetical protein ThimaDRAFT_1184 [Thiocapsa marina 5811]
MNDDSPDPVVVGHASKPAILVSARALCASRVGRGCLNDALPSARGNNRGRNIDDAHEDRA